MIIDNQFTHQWDRAASLLHKMMEEEDKRLNKLGFVRISTVQDSFIYEYKGQTMKTSPAPNNNADVNPDTPVAVAVPPRQTHLKLSRKERRKLACLMRYAFEKGEAMIEVGICAGPNAKREACLEVAVTDKHIKRFKLKEVTTGYVVYAQINTVTIGKVRARTLFA